MHLILLLLSFSLVNFSQELSIDSRLNLRESHPKVKNQTKIVFEDSDPESTLILMVQPRVAQVQIQKGKPPTTSPPTPPSPVPVLKGSEDRSHVDIAGLVPPSHYSTNYYWTPYPTSTLPPPPRQPLQPSFFCPSYFEPNYQIGGSSLNYNNNRRYEWNLMNWPREKNPAAAASGGGRWIPCRPVELGLYRRIVARGVNGCPEETETEGFVTPVNHIDGKTDFEDDSKDMKNP